MTEIPKKTAKKPAEVKVPAVKKAAAAPKPAAKKIEKATAPKTGAQVKVTQVVGSIGRRADQRATLIGLGLNKRHRSKVLEDTPSVRGMIYKVRHLLVVEQA